MIDEKTLLSPPVTVTLTQHTPKQATRPLPPMLYQSSDCERCYQASECMVLHAAVEAGNTDSSRVPELFKYALKGVSSSHIQYLTHWERYVTDAVVIIAPHCDLPLFPFSTLPYPFSLLSLFFLSSLFPLPVCGLCIEMF